MTRGLLAGAALGLLLVVAGTLIGTFRALVLAPRLGSGWALALELPLMLFIAWRGSGALKRRFRVAAGRGPRRRMAAAAALVLFTGEAALASVLFGIGPAAWLAGFARPSAWPGLAAQVAACLMPVAGSNRRERRERSERKYRR